MNVVEGFDDDHCVVVSMDDRILEINEPLINCLHIPRKVLSSSRYGYVYGTYILPSIAIDPADAWQARKIIEVTGATTSFTRYLKSGQIRKVKTGLVNYQGTPARYWMSRDVTSSHYMSVMQEIAVSAKSPQEMQQKLLMALSFYNASFLQAA